MVSSSSRGEPGYRGSQVCKIVGITYRQLDYWARTDLLRPSVSDARGSGSQRLYSYTDLLRLKVVKRLLASGLSLQSARKAIECLRSSGEEVATANLVIAEGGTLLVTSGEQIIDLLKGGQGVLNVLPLGNLVAELQAAVSEIKPWTEDEGEAKGATSSAPRSAPTGTSTAAQG
ncbi:MAG: MerR family transcriptional regulator [Acidimicrobiales bacterium]